MAGEWGQSIRTGAGGQVSAFSIWKGRCGEFESGARRMGAGAAWCVEATRNTLRGRRENREQIGNKEPGLGAAREVHVHSLTQDSVRWLDLAGCPLMTGGEEFLA